MAGWFVLGVVRGGVWLLWWVVGGGFVVVAVGRFGRGRVVWGGVGLVSQVGGGPRREVWGRRLPSPAGRFANPYARCSEHGPAKMYAMYVMYVTYVVC